MTETLSVVDQLWIEQKGRCYLCGYAMDRLNPMLRNYRSIEHVIPLSRGGTNARENKRLACRICNTIKDAMTHDEWIKKKEQTELRVRRFLARQQRFDATRSYQRAYALRRRKPAKSDIT